LGATSRAETLRAGPPADRASERPETKVASGGIRVSRVWTSRERSLEEKEPEEGSDPRECE
jgi:hypothetical protein